ncbi:MAG: hypothetical protein MUC91_13675, partial [Verrucomicrobia bacterium]|nr:hypothetical protein [Verrucomicrobiota bacterium]
MRLQRFVFRKSWLVWPTMLCLVTVPLCGRAEEVVRAPEAASGGLGVVLEVHNREIITFRAAIGPYSPAQRAAAATVLIRDAEPTSGGARVDSERMADSVNIRINRRTVFVVAPGDVNPLVGETLESVVQRAERRLDLVLDELEER